MPSARLFLIGEAADIILPSAGNGVNDAIADAVTACSGTNALVAQIGMLLAAEPAKADRLKGCPATVRGRDE